MRRNASLLPVLALVWLMGPTAARAEFIPWKYNWSRNPSEIMSDAPGTGKITLTDETLKSAAGDSDIVATNIKVFSTASPDNPDRFTNKGYTLTLFLMDELSAKSGALSFSGVFNGTVSALSSNLENAFLDATTKELDLGDNRYTVTIGPYVPPGPPSSSNSGAVSAFAQVRINQISKTPEPSSLLLAALGLPMLGVAAWRRRRRDVDLL